jgi:hypothetical protein
LEVESYLNTGDARQGEKQKASRANLNNLFGGLTVARVGVSGLVNDLSKIVQKYGGAYSGFISKKVSTASLYSIRSSFSGKLLTFYLDQRGLVLVNYARRLFNLDLLSSALMSSHLPKMSNSTSINLTQHESITAVL